MDKKKFRQGSEDYLMHTADDVITRLVSEKTHLYKAYNYYQGFRDKYQYEHLEVNYGIGSPTSIKFTPLVRKHIDAIVGEYLTRKINPLISCKDQKTLTNIQRDKQLLIHQKVKDHVSKFLNNAVYNLLQGQSPQDQKTFDAVVQKEVDEIIDSVNRDYISNYEIAAQIVIEDIKNSREIDLKNLILQLFLDLLIAGELYYRVVPGQKESNFKIEVLDPLNTFVFVNHQSKYIKNGTKSVVRTWLTKEEIAIKYGDELSETDLDSLENSEGGYITRDSDVWIPAMHSRGWLTPTCEGGVQINGITDFYDFPYELLPVYEVEWIDYSKKENRGVLYKVTKIGEDIYIFDGEDEYQVRSIDNPKSARLTVNGLRYSNRGCPYSLMLTTADLQDAYDLLLYQKDNLIALGGTKVANVDIAHLPEFLGETPKERVLKYQAYRKLGLAFFDSAQEGEPVNQMFANSDDSVSANAVQAIQLGIQIIEDTVSSITGVFRERLGGIQARDAVANVEAGMQQSYIISKQYHQAMDTIISEMLVDALNISKKVFKKGRVGTLLLGNYKDIYTSLPEDISFTEYDIKLADSQELDKEKEVIKQYAMEMAKSQMADPLDVISILTAKSFTDAKYTMEKTIKQKKKESDQLGKMSETLQQYEQQIKDLSTQLQDSTKKLQQLNERKLAVEQQNNQMKQNIEWYKAKSLAEFQQRQLDIMEKKASLEALQMYDNNPNNDDVDHKRF